ncbi:unnamed protein product [Cuscuta campestris]|uniref:Zinc finger CCCH domain-containing protein 7 n=1 Tax=Cuscuta campestris TaxID=132261 RepID=A0A484NI94_9ASTE|nr:unnamed protein product [Cuscuta campestris]
MEPFHHHHHQQRYVHYPPNFPDSPNCFPHPPPPPPHPSHQPPLPPPNRYHHGLPPPPPPPPNQFAFRSYPHQENPQFFDSPMRTLEPWSDVGSKFQLHQPHHHHQDPFLPPLKEHNGGYRFTRDDYVANNGFRDNDERKWDRKDRDFYLHDHVDKFRFNSERSIQHRLDYRKDRDEEPRRGYRDVNDDVRQSSSRRFSSDNNYAFDPKRLSNRAGESIEEFHRSPKKKHFQKKIAPIRTQLGKTNNKTRNQDLHFSSGLVDNLSVAGSRGKEKDGNARSGERGEERENSPVELDVSFKSNALVAKAIVAPSRPAAESDKKSVDRVHEIKKLKMSDSPPTKAFKDFQNCEHPANGSDCPSLFEKGSTELVGNVSGSEKATDGVSNACTPTKNCGLNQGADGTQNDEASLRKIVQEKNVMASTSDENSLMQNGVSDSPVISADKLVNKFSVSELDENATGAEERILSAGMNEDCNYSSAHHSIEELDANKICEPSVPVDSGTDDSKNDSSTPFKSKRKRTCLSVIPVSESQVDTKIKEHSVSESKLLENRSVFNSEKFTIDPPKTETGPIIDKDAREHGFQDQTSMIKTSLVQESDVYMVSIKNNGHMCSPSSEEGVIHGDTSIYSLTEDVCAAPETLVRFSEQTENVAAEVGCLHEDSKHFDKSLTIPHTDDMHKGPQDSILSVRDVTKVGSPNTEEVLIHQGLLCASCSNSCSTTRVYSDTVCSCMDNKALSQSCSPINIVGEARPHCNGSPAPLVGGEDCHDLCLGKEYLPEAKRKRKALGILSTSSSQVTSDELMHSCSSVDLSLDVNRDNSLYGGQSHQGLPWNDSETDSAVTSPRNSKKRKISSPTHGHPSTCFEVLDEASISAPVLSDGDNGITHTISLVVENGSDALPPCTRPIINLHEKNSTRASLQADTTQVDLSEALSGFEQVPSFFHMGVGEKEATSFVSVSNDQNCTLDSVSRICEQTSLNDMASTIEDGECCDGLPTSNFSAEIKSCIPDISTLKSSSCLALNEVVPQVDRYVNEPTVSTGNAVSFSVKMSTDNPKVGGDAVSVNLPMNITTSPSLPSVSGKPIVSKSSFPDACKPLQTLISVPSRSNFTNNKVSSVVPRVFSSSPSVSFTTSQKVTLPRHVAKPRTWHRTGSSSSVSQVSSIRPQSQSPNEVLGMQNSYIRKGNALVRNSSRISTMTPGYHASSSSVYRLNSSSLKDVKKVKSDNVVEITEPTSCLKTSGPITSLQSLNSEPLNFMRTNVGKPTSLSVVDQSGSSSLAREQDGLEVTAMPRVQKHSEDAVNSFQCPPDAINKSEGENTLDGGKTINKMLNLKQRSNQLVTARDTTPTSSSDGYYCKRRNNQLVRTGAENHVNSRVPVDDSSNTGMQGAGKAVTKRQIGFPDAHKSSKLSLVWTLSGARSSREGGNSLKKFQPYRCPWKRYTNKSPHALGSIQNIGSLSAISQKLLLSRNRHTVYTRSANGLSLRRSKVLSVGGTSLKWSKSIERNSRKANQEATLAVAAAEKRKRGHNIIVTSSSKSRNNVV